MSSVSTFGAFTTARLGIYAAQKGLEVTGNNITNINTAGYTRQRLDQISLRTGGRDKYQSIYDVNVGNGVLCTGVSQLRDPYLDIRYRNEQSNVGALDAKLSGLEELSSILDEVLTGADDNGKFQAQISDLLDQLDSLNNTPNQEEFDTLVRTSAEALAKMINTAATDLETVLKNQETAFRQDIDTVNGILKSLGEINDSIMKSDIHGDSALELRDERNLMLDQLSQYMKIDVTYEPEEVGAGITIERMVVKLAGSGKGDPDTEKSVLVNGTYATQVEAPGKVPELNPNFGLAGHEAEGKYMASTPGTTTNTVEDANLVDNKNYDLALDALKDAKNRVLEIAKKSEPVGAPSYDDLNEAKGFLKTLPGMDPLPDDPDNWTVVSRGENGDVTTVKYKINEIKEDPDDPDAVTGYRIEKTTSTVSGEVALSDNDLYGSLQAQREMLTEAGEFTSKGTVNLIDPEAATKRGIPYYQHALDAFANKFAEVLNGANTLNRTDKDGYLRDEDGKFLYLDNTVAPNGQIKAVETLAEIPEGRAALRPADLDDTTSSISATLRPELREKTATGGALFSNSSDGDDTTGITAKNIAISQKWSTRSIKIQTTRIYGEGSTAGDNVLHIKTLIEGDQAYRPNDVMGEGQAVDGDTAYFTGSFAKMLINTGSVLANDKKVTTALLQNAATSLDERYVSRDSVMGVDLNDEAANMMMYQKSYAAACRLMTTLDEALDKLINGTGVVGR